MRWPACFFHLINQCMRNELDTLSAHFLHKTMICFGGAGVGIVRRIPFVYHACVFGVSEDWGVGVFWISPIAVLVRFVA